MIAFSMSLQQPTGKYEFRALSTQYVCFLFPTSIYSVYPRLLYLLIYRVKSHIHKVTLRNIIRIINLLYRSTQTCYLNLLRKLSLKKTAFLYQKQLYSKHKRIS